MLKNIDSKIKQTMSTSRQLA